MISEIEGRPLLAGALGLVVGLTLPWHIVNALFAIALIWFVRKNLKGVLFAAFGCFVGVIAGPDGQVTSSTPGTFSGIVTVVSIPGVSTNSESCIVEADRERLQLTIRGHSSVDLGDTVRIYGAIKPLHGEEGARLQLQGVAGSIIAPAEEVVVVQKGSAVAELASTLRRKIDSGIEASLAQGPATLVESLCFGGSPRVDRQLRNDLQNSGSLHILSASGLQVFIIAWLAQALFSFVPVSRTTQLVVVAMLLLLYVLACGAHPSTIRAAIVSILSLSAYLFGREADVLSALSVAAIATLIWQPWTVYTAGFQLSFVCVAALALYWRRANHSKNILDILASRAWQMLRASLILSLAAAPIVAFHFGVLSLVAPVTNLLLAPVLPLIVGGTFVAAAFAAVPILQVGILQTIVAPLAGYAQLIVGSTGNAPWSSVQIPSFNAYWLTPYYAAMLLLWVPRRHR